MQQPTPPRSQESLHRSDAPVNAFRRLVAAQGAPMLLAGLGATALGYRDADEILALWVGLWVTLVLPASFTLAWLAARIERRASDRAPVGRGAWLPAAACAFTVTA